MAVFGDTWTLQGGLHVALHVFQIYFIPLAILAFLALRVLAVWATLSTTSVVGVLVVTLYVGTVQGGTIPPMTPQMTLGLACAVAVYDYLAANFNAPQTGLALAVE